MCVYEIDIYIYIYISKKKKKAKCDLPTVVHILLHFLFPFTVTCNK